VKGLSEKTLLVSVCTGSRIFGKAGLLNGVRATSRKHGDPCESTDPLDRLAEIDSKAIIERSRIVDSGRMITAGGISSGLELGFYLLERFGYDEGFLDKIAYVMEYEQQWKLMKSDRLVI
jgi:transcriptional regulator GlxA family with amidase domain